MLITNFGSGELSKTMFGRTDLHQYKNGAARLENFDVIPTGGLRRRSGTEWLRDLNQEVRLIPFNVSRKENFLLMLSPGKIEAYKITNGGISGSPQTFGSSSSLRLYENMAQIKDVQFAQNFDTMILCHEEYAPIEVKLENNAIAVATLKMEFKVPVAAAVAAGGNITAQDKAGYEGEDEQYKSKNWLTSEKNYPAAGTFYNGRLVFAGTINDRQRLFFSAIRESGKLFSFHTKKILLAEKKDYVVVRGSIAPSSNTIVIPNNREMPFKRAITSYMADSPFFEPGASIEEISGIDDDFDEIKMSSDCLLSLPYSFDDIKALEEWKKKLDKVEASTAAYANIGQPGHPNGTRYEPEFKMLVCATKAVIDVDGLRPESQFTMPITNEIAAAVREKSDDEAVAYLKDEFLTSDLFDNLAKQAINSSVSFYATADFNKAMRDMVANIRTYWQYQLNGEEYLGRPADIYEEVMDYFKREAKEAGVPFNSIQEMRKEGVYIMFYSREIESTTLTTAEHGFTFELAGDAQETIRWLAVNRGLMAGTDKSEWVIPPDIHALNISATCNSRHGSDTIQGTMVGDATIFFQAGRKSLVEYYIPQADDHFRANDMALCSQQMLSESPAVDFDFMTSPYAKLLITREDGTMVTLLYERSTGTFAWGRTTAGPETHENILKPEFIEKLARDSEEYRRLAINARRDAHTVDAPQGPDIYKRTSGGRIRCAAVLPGADGCDDVYLIVERNGARSLERLRENCGTYLDCWRPVSQQSWAGVRAAYPAGGVKVQRVYDYVDKNYYSRDKRMIETLDADAEPNWTQGGEFYIGYPYTSAVRTMPFTPGDGKKRNISGVAIRFLESYPVTIATFAAGKESDNRYPVSIKPPFTGIERTSLAGWDEEPQIEIRADQAAPATILSIFEEEFKK